MAMKTKITKYDDGWKSQSWYYIKRCSKTFVSLILTSVIIYMTGDSRFLALVPFLEVVQKVVKEKGYWY